jgi:hypothetical protein
MDQSNNDNNINTNTNTIIDIQQQQTNFTDNFTSETNMLFELAHQIRYMYEDDIYDEYEESENVSNTYQSDTEEEIMHNSFYCEPRYIKVFDIKNNKELLKHCCYDPKIHKNSSCCIYMVDFKEDDEVVELPCGHCFVPEAIYNWLERQSNLCPCCRYELPHMEIENTEYATTTMPIYPNNALNVNDLAHIQNNEIMLDMLSYILDNNYF